MYVVLVAIAVVLVGVAAVLAYNGESIIDSFNRV